MKRIDRVFSHELASYLNEDNEANWCMWNKGRGMTPNSLAKQLKEFDIISKSIRIGLNTAKGYLKDQFNDAFTRYLTTLPVESAITNVTTSQIKAHNENSQNSKGHNGELLRFENQPQDNSPLTCDVVTFQNTPTTGGSGEQAIKTPQSPNTTHSINDLMADDEGVYFDLD